MQLPPSFAFDAAIVTPFLDLVRREYDGPVVCEPRHPTWFSPQVDSLLEVYRVSRVAADPPPVPAAAVPGAGRAWHTFDCTGHPGTYWSRYDEHYVATLADTLRSIPSAEEAWCVFDNTASGAAIENAWQLHELLTAEALG